MPAHIYSYLPQATNRSGKEINRPILVVSPWQQWLHPACINQPRWKPNKIKRNETKKTGGAEDQDIYMRRHKISGNREPEKISRTRKTAATSNKTSTALTNKKKKTSRRNRKTQNTASRRRARDPRGRPEAGARRGALVEHALQGVLTTRPGPLKTVIRHHCNNITIPTERPRREDACVSV